MPPTEKAPSFEESLAELESVLRTLEDGATGLDESLACYEKGVGLLKRCYGQLRQAEQRVLTVTGSDDGPTTIQPFGPAPAEAPAAVRKPRANGRARDEAGGLF